MGNYIEQTAIKVNFSDLLTRKLETYQKIIK